MAEVKIKTLTPIHIGSGRELRANTEFIEFVNGEDRSITVIDEKKVLGIIGEENVDQWVSIINRQENLKDYLVKRNPDLKPEDIEKRSMFVYGGKISGQTTLKEQIHSAGEDPMIPGSSIKGAIRTAVIEYLVEKHTHEVQKIIERKRDELDRKKNKWTLKDFQFIEKDILNKLLSNTFKVDANKNTFRFLQVGDAIFKYTTMATNIQILNLQHNGWNIKRGTDQITEVVGSECETTTGMKINGHLLERNLDRRNIQSDISFFKNAETLFKIVNDHTKVLLAREIKLWEEMEESYPEDLLDIYINNLKAVLQVAEKCQANETVLRIGGGSGWDFITGGWAKTNEKLFTEDEWYHLSNMLNKGRDVDYFPKTRKLDEYGDILGFVELEITK